MSTTEIVSKDVKKLQVKEATEIGGFYGIPQTLVNVFFLDFSGTLYPKEAFLLYQAQKKGYQRLHVVVSEKTAGYWEAEARIYPVVTSRMLENLVKLAPDQQGRMIDYLTQPTVEWGKASKETVKAGPMQPYLKEMAIKRAVARACRLFSGVGTTAFEELPEATMTQDEIKEAADLAKPVEPVPDASATPAPQPPAAEALGLDATLDARLAYDLKPWTEDGGIVVAPFTDYVEVKVMRTIAGPSAAALSKVMETYKARKTLAGNQLLFTVAR